MELLFHIGTAKTGTSALQSAFAGSGRYLAECGVVYPLPRRWRPERNHRLYASQCAPAERMPRHMARFGDAARLQAGFARFHAGVKARVARCRPELVLMSSETVFRLTPEFAPRFRAVLGEFGVRPAFVAYLRQPSEHYLSLLQQRLRASSVVAQPRPPRLRRAVAAYEDAFGPGCLALHLFHREALVQRDVVADFVARHLAPYGVEAARLRQVGEVNTSLGPESMTLMQAYRARFHPGRDERFTWDSEALHRRLRAADAAIGAPRPGLRPGVAAMIDHTSDDPLWLRDRFGIVFPDLDYRPLEAGPRQRRPRRPLALEEIVAVNAGRRAAILEHLAGSGWARFRPERRRWIADLAKRA